ncbi:unnamed protein product [Cladocopium goreaui]|uniref:HAT C-terminal dimerisation domain-containing protein n=1 Tax=Cladocopium goreaui TaxID=2562237 RepID=A0A9P1CJF9_9DINO|nr:unnamed protein product [Cladocopium goreaui]
MTLVPVKVGGRNLQRKMLYCIGQAARLLTLKKLKAAEVDPRKHRMALRYSSCSLAMETSSGFLGIWDQAEHQDLTAVGVRDATMGILKELCTPSSVVPFTRDTLPLQFGDALDALKPKVEQFCTDAAGDEMVAAELLKLDFTNLRIRSKDTAHASRRIASRCTQADPYLARVLKKYVTGGQSPAQLLQFRPYFAKRFGHFVKSNNGWSCKNLRAAKHRFESLQKPLGRLVLHMQPLLVTMETLCRERAGKAEGKTATEFLEQWSVEEALTLAALADAHDEAFLVTRVADSDSFQPTDLMYALETFQKNIACMFTRGYLFETPGTYSTFLLETLKTPVVLIHKGKQLVLGGPDAITSQIKHRVMGRPSRTIFKLQSRCIYLPICHYVPPPLTCVQRSLRHQCARMMNWVKVATTILETEFPSFGVCMHLAVALRLNLQVDKMPRPSQDSAKALATAWGLDKDTHPKLKIS